MKGVKVTLSNITKKYGALTALKEVTLDIPRGSFFTILGPSGCGKSTLLGIIAGFIEPTEGRVLFDSHDVTRVPPQKRKVGMVFQDLALFPHMTVYDNIAFGLNVKKMPQEEIRRKVREVMELVRLEYSEYAHRLPHQLSGGQQQRVALARALAVDPRVLLLDEPLSHVDYSIKMELLEELKRIQRHSGVTTVYVTHDQSEAMYLADWLAVMNYGRVEQVGRPEEIYDAPKSLFVARFFGDVNVFPPEAFQVARDTVKMVGVRLEHTVLTKNRPQVGNGVLGYLEGVVTEKIFQGANILYRVQTSYGEAKAIVPRRDSSGFSVGDKVYLVVPRKNAIIFKE